MAIGDDSDRDTAVDEQAEHLNTASSWHPGHGDSFASFSSQQQR
jgi:hypothetical protein